MIKTPVETGAIHFDLGRAGSFEMPAIAEEDSHSVSVLMFQAAGDSLADMAEKVTAITADSDLSDAGKAKKLEPLQREVMLTIANADRQLDDEMAHFDKREADLTQIPALDPTHSAMATEDREIRDHLRAIGLPAALALAIESGNERVQIAILRSPIPQNDELKKRALEVWKESKRLANPAEAVAIDAGRAALEWARKGLANVVGNAVSTTRWDSKRILNTLLTSENERHHGAYKAFGLSPQQAEQTKRGLAFKAGQRF